MTLNQSVEMRPRLGVTAWVIQEGKVLMGQRKNANGEGTWAAPGGHLEFGETPFEAATRELLEETNLKAHVIEAGPWTNDFFENLGKHYITLHFFVTDFSGELKLMEPNKCSGWNWLPVDEIPENIFLPIANLLQKGSFIDHLAAFEAKSV